MYLFLLIHIKFTDVGESYNNHALLMGDTLIIGVVPLTDMLLQSHPYHPLIPRSYFNMSRNASCSKICLQISLASLAKVFKRKCLLT